MSIIKYDPEENTLFIKKDPQNNENSIEENSVKDQEVAATVSSPKMKAYMLTVTNDAEDIERARQGVPLKQTNKVHLFPVLAPNEEAGISAARQQGYEVINLTPYEFLRFQVDLIEKIARDSNIEILVEDVFKVEELKKVQ